MAEARDAVPVMSADERVEYIYRDLVAVSPYVRRSMLVYNCVSSDYTGIDERTGQQVVRRVLWMTTSHPFFSVIQRLVDGHHPDVTIHRSSLAGIPMRGVDWEIVNQIADLIWCYFLADTVRFPVYAEDGTKLATLPFVKDDGSITVDVGTGNDQEAVPIDIEHPVLVDVNVGDGILIGRDQHAHHHVSTPALPTSYDHPKKE